MLKIAGLSKSFGALRALDPGLEIYTRACPLFVALAEELARAEARSRRSGKPARCFKSFMWQTRASWSRKRRVVGKAEVMAGGDNPRFIVTNLPREGFRGEDRERLGAARLYEELYCARGDMENQLKQQVLDLQADRMSTHYLASNQLRLWLTTFAYLLLERVRTLGLAGTIDPSIKHPAPKASCESSPANLQEARRARLRGGEDLGSRRPPCTSRRSRRRSGAQSRRHRREYRKGRA